MASATKVDLPLADYAAFEALTKAQQKWVVSEIGKQRALGSRNGGSGNDMRARFGDWLTGPRRCKLFREFGHGELIGPSYAEYDDPDGVDAVTRGRQRIGSRHARWHGTSEKAEARREELAAQMAPVKKPARRRRTAKKVTS